MKTLREHLALLQDREEVAQQKEWFLDQVKRAPHGLPHILIGKVSCVNKKANGKSGATEPHKNAHLASLNFAPNFFSMAALMTRWVGRVFMEWNAVISD
jgi:hypothetical protein